MGVDAAQQPRSAALLRVLEAAVALHLRLRSVTEQLHDQPDLTRACRGALRDLARLGPLTVPQLARRRDCSRQHLQLLVNRLVAGGMAELLDNPDHRRSRLVRLTDRGREALESMWAREAELIERMPVASSASELDATARVLGELRQALPDGPATTRRGPYGPAG